MIYKKLCKPFEIHFFSLKVFLKDSSFKTIIFYKTLFRTRLTIQSHIKIYERGSTKRQTFILICLFY